MIAIKQAAFTRLIPSDGKLYGEVKVIPEGDQGTYLAWYAPDGRGGFRLEKLIRKEEDLELDWYDNDLHHAFEDVTSQSFAGPAEQEGFGEGLLSYGSISAEMQSRFAEQAAGWGVDAGTENESIDL